MSKAHIVTDSNCNIPAALCQELDITIVPLPFVWDGRSYLDGIDMSAAEFYSRLRGSQSIPTTSGPTPGAFIEIYERLSSDGNPILSVHVGSEFSSTLFAAATAKETVSKAIIELVDSHSNALGLGFQVLALARAAREGRDLASLLSIARSAVEATGVVFAVDDIRYLHRGGRIGFGQRLLASSLNLLPIMEVRRGPVALIDRVRSSKRVIPRLVELAEKRLAGGGPRRIGVLHADHEQQGWELKKAVEEKLAPDEVFFEELNTILGIHAGPGALGLAYCLGL